MVLVQRQSAQIALVAEVALWKSGGLSNVENFYISITNNMIIKHACGKLQNFL
jgi:hypothetical protein